MVYPHWYTLAACSSLACHGELTACSQYTRTRTHSQVLRGASPCFVALMDAGMRDSESGEVKLSAQEYPPPIVRARPAVPSRSSEFISQLNLGVCERF
jgi:hypothetical protein